MALSPKRHRVISGCVGTGCRILEIASILGSETAGELIRVLEVFPPQLQTFCDPPTGTNTTLVSPRRFDKE